MSDAPDNGSTTPSISNAEWEVMQALWRHGPMAARDVYAALPQDHGWAYKTVKTLLSRLVAKGAADYEQIGNSYLYHPVFTRDQMTREEVRGFVDRVLDGSLMPVVMHFIEDRGLSEDEAAELQRLLRKKDGRNTTRKRRRKP